jgi:ParB-like nuclease domain
VLSNLHDTGVSQSTPPPEIDNPKPTPVLETEQPPTALPITDATSPAIAITSVDQTQIVTASSAPTFSEAIAPQQIESLLEVFKPTEPVPTVQCETSTHTAPASPEHTVTDDRQPDAFLPINVALIDDRPYGRTVDIASPANVTLFADVAVRGVKTPLLVRPIERGRYEIIDGARRKAAAILAEEMSLPCMVREIPLERAMIERLRLSQHSVPMNSIEYASIVWSALKQHLNLNDVALRSWIERLRNVERGRVEASATWNVPGKANDKRDVAAMIEKTATFLKPIMEIATLQRSYMPLLRMPDDLREMVIDETLSASAARKIATVTDAKLRSELIARAREKPVSVRSLNTQIQMASSNASVKRKPQTSSHAAAETNPTEFDSFGAMTEILDRIMAGEFGADLQSEAREISINALVVIHLARESNPQKFHSKSQPRGKRVVIN